jgi:hypothetical protein
MGVISTQSLNLLVKNARAQIETNKKLLDASKVEADSLVAKASEQIKAYFESLYAMDLPLDNCLKSVFNNNDGEGKFYIMLVHESDRKYAYIEYADSGKRYIISETHIENGEPINYDDENADNYDRAWSYGLKSQQNQAYSEKICKTIMQCFDKIQDTFNLKILEYVNNACTESKNKTLDRNRVIEVLKQNLKEEE